MKIHILIIIVLIPFNLVIAQEQCTKSEEYGKWISRRLEHGRYSNKGKSAFEAAEIIKLKCFCENGYDENGPINQSESSELLNRLIPEAIDNYTSLNGPTVWGESFSIPTQCKSIKPDKKPDESVLVYNNSSEMANCLSQFNDKPYILNRPELLGEYEHSYKSSEVFIDYKIILKQNGEGVAIKKFDNPEFPPASVKQIDFKWGIVESFTKTDTQYYTIAMASNIENNEFLPSYRNGCVIDKIVIEPKGDIYLDLSFASYSALKVKSGN